MKFTSKSLEETKEIAKKFVDTIEPMAGAAVVALQGDLGAGKTAFTQAVGEIVGVDENMHSPTFVIEKIYPISFKGFRHLIHIDAYRIENESELLHLGWEEMTRDPKNLILVEWPENVSSLIPKDAIKISLKFIDEETRTIEIHEK
ncbi:MAG: tRNA (adenosine(37)-N6)-threonylcarbamoyltransferase complex ATPase subunit type 1 TsaE [bacterium]|nr:tRNA (adenosine(37)-N6)-threonylcarbamoyltransferase complex ATPase subunit type 1 TsaE [bacterium]